MALTRWDPFSTLSRMDREFDDLVRRTWGGQGAGFRSGFVPAVEMITRGEDVVIRLELPGVDPANDVDIEIEPGKLTIRGERRYESENQGEGGVLVRELRYGSFHREFALPEGVGEDAIEARYEHGMLEVLVKGVVRRPPEPKKVQIRGGDKSKTVETGKHEEITS